MAPIIRIENIADYVGQQVTIQGWLYNSTRKGKLMFLRLRDGSGYPCRRAGLTSTDGPATSLRIDRQLRWEFRPISLRAELN